jgi:hypothetical protein
VKRFFFFVVVHVYVVPHRFWVFFNVFSFNFLRLHQNEDWQIDLTINGNMSLELCLGLHPFILCDLGGSIGCAKFE